MTTSKHNVRCAAIRTLHRAQRHSMRYTAWRLVSTATRFRKNGSKFHLYRSIRTVSGTGPSEYVGHDSLGLLPSWSDNLQFQFVALIRTGLGNLDKLRALEIKHEDLGGQLRMKNEEINRLRLEFENLNRAQSTGPTTEKMLRHFVDTYSDMAKSVRHYLRRSPRSDFAQRIARSKTEAR